MAVAISEKKEKFLQQFRVDEGVSGVSKAAELALENISFPTTREEYWKYTRLAKVQNGEFNLIEFDGELQVESVNEDALHVECVNGFFRKPEGTVPQGVLIDELSDIDYSIVDDQTQFFSALNTAYYTSAIKIKVEAGVQVDKSIQLNFTQSESNIQAQPRIQIEVEDGANVNFILNWHSNESEACFWNGVSEISVGRNAQVQIHQLQRGGDENYLINTTQVVQQRDSRFSIYTISLEGKICRNNLIIDVEGENCETRLNGVYLPHGKQHIDNHTYVDHKVPYCFSSENYKGVLDDQSTAVFNGKVMVRQDAQKINAFQKQPEYIVVRRCDHQLQTRIGNLCRRRKVFAWINNWSIGCRSTFLLAIKGSKCGKRKKNAHQSICDRRVGRD